MQRRNFLKTTALGTAGLAFSRLYSMEPRIERFSNGKYCLQPGADIPVIAAVDLLVAGATLGGIAAAIAAAEKGSRVFVVGYMPYPGEDICGTFSHLFNEHEGFEHNDLLRKLFGTGKDVSPMHVKTVLEKELIDRNIDFLYCSYVTDIIFEEGGKPAGVIINNRTGRQAVLSSGIIDCTAGANLARLAGARFKKLHESGEYDFRLVTVGNDPAGQENVSSSRLPSDAVVNRNRYPVLEHKVSLPVSDFSFVSLSGMEQKLRDLTWDANQVDSADNISFDAPCRLVGRGLPAGSYEDPGDLPVEAFIPEGIDNLYVFGPCADLPGEISREFGKPARQVKLGRSLGAAASEIMPPGGAHTHPVSPPGGATTNPVSPPGGPHVNPVSPSGGPHANPVSPIGKPLAHNPGKPGQRQLLAGYFTRPVKGIEYLNGITGEISETLRPNLGSSAVFSERTALPVLGEYDVVVVGGGTAGAPAAISAARNGARTLVMEYLHGLGGTGTLGLIGRYWYGHRDGFTKEIDKGVREMADPSHPRQKSGDHEWVVDWKMEWYRREIRKAGGDIWFGVIAAGAFVENGRVKGVMIATPEGRGVVLARQVIDSTGSADVAIAAGAEYEYVGRDTVAVQGSGLPKVDPGDHYNNTDWTFVDDSDVFDITRVFISGKRKFPGAWDLGKLPQTRERRRIKAQFMVSPIDMLNGRRYPDTISYHVSNFDTHGYTVHPYFIIKQPDGGHVTYDVDLPLRSLLPRGVDGIIVTGLGAGAHRDAMPVIRMQPCLQNQGYAVGLLAARMVKENATATTIDVRDLQKHLTEIGNLPVRVVTDDDNMPLPDESFSEAISKIGNDFEMLEVLFTDMKRGVELLKGAVTSSDDHNIRLNSAIALGVLGIDDGWRTLAEALDKANGWDEGWNFTGMHQFGHSLGRLDIITIALGRCRREEALPSIMRMAGMLKPSHYFSHFRAVSVAFETLGNSKAAPLLFDLLGMPGMTGHQVITRTDAVRATVPSTEDVTLRNNVLKELHLARALYRCGDHYGLGRQILENYSNDLHGHYFRHAAGVLGLAPEFV